jgi:hypothetical protein
MFDPFCLATCNVEAAKLLVEKLKHFNRPEFIDEFPDDLRKEIPEAKRHSKMRHDWEDVPRSKLRFQRCCDRQICTRQQVTHVQDGNAENADLVGMTHQEGGNAKNADLVGMTHQEGEKVCKQLGRTILVSERGEFGLGGFICWSWKRSLQTLRVCLEKS